MFFDIGGTESACCSLRQGYIFIIFRDGTNGIRDTLKLLPQTSRNYAAIIFISIRSEKLTFFAPDGLSWNFRIWIMTNTYASCESFIFIHIMVVEIYIFVIRYKWAPFVCIECSAPRLKQFFSEEKIMSNIISNDL